jgi:hypothetical protein
MKISEKKISFFSTQNQYFPHIPYVASKKCLLQHMEYEGSIGFVSIKMKKKKIADFHVLGLFMVKKLDLNEKKFPYVTRQGR